MLHSGVWGGNLPAGGQKTKFRPNIWKIRTPPVKYVGAKSHRFRISCTCSPRTPMIFIVMFRSRSNSNLTSDSMVVYPEDPQKCGVDEIL